MIKRKNWSYSQAEKKRIKDTVLAVVKKWRESDGDTFDKDYVMVQPSSIILHNGKNSIGNSRFVNKVSFYIYNGTVGGHAVKVATDSLYWNEDFIKDVRTALEELE